MRSDDMEEKAGLCRICGRAGRHTCRLCGKLVCDNDYDKSAKMCVICKMGKMVKG